VGTILDDDGPKLVIEDASLIEGDSGQSDMLFTVRLTQPAVQVISVNFATADITARAGLDYLADQRHRGIRSWRNGEDHRGPGPG
jgi:large repetitive protein